MPAHGSLPAQAGSHGLAAGLTAPSFTVWASVALFCLQP